MGGADPNFDPHLWAPYGGKNSNFLGTIKTNLEQLARQISFQNLQWEGPTQTSTPICGLSMGEKIPIFSEQLEQI